MMYDEQIKHEALAYERAGSRLQTSSLNGKLDLRAGCLGPPMRCRLASVGPN